MVITQHDKFFIGGRWVQPASNRRFEVIGAATEQQIGSVPEGVEADIDAAVAAARQAFDNSGWASSTPAERAVVMNRFADAVEKRADEIASVVSQQIGMPISQSEIAGGRYPATLLRYYAQLANDMEIEELRPSPLGFNTLIRREAIGVVAAIVPWNFPTVLAMTKIGPALAAGCSIVLKPSPGTVLDSYLFAEAAEEAGFPDGVINWVPADREVGAYLVSHPGVDKVAFTGSTAAGRSIAETCGRLLRPVTLELGGKSAAIVLDDADLGAVTEGLTTASLLNNGQFCSANTRILAPSSRYEEVVDALTSWASSLVVGDPLDPATQIGPVASAVQRDRIESYIARGISEGGRVTIGGARPTDQQYGWFVPPTIFADVDNSSTIAREEIFGPVLAVVRYDQDADAVAVANDSEYGLGGSVWSADQQRAVAVASQVQTGTIGVNGYMIDMNAPFGGVKSSGMGREFGPEAIESYQQSKSMYLMS